MKIMGYGRFQEYLLIGILLVLVFYILLPLVSQRTSVERPPQLPMPTAEAATNITVWTYQKTGMYYCPDSKLYGKAKPGKYVTQEKALASGYEPAGGNACR
jgi:hypothetical protein